MLFITYVQIQTNIISGAFILYFYLQLQKKINKNKFLMRLLIRIIHANLMRKKKEKSVFHYSLFNNEKKRLRLKNEFQEMKTMLSFSLFHWNFIIQLLVALALDYIKKSFILYLLLFFHLLT